MKMHDKKLLRKSLSGRGKLRRGKRVALVCLLSLAAVSTVQATPEQAKRMHDRLASIPPNEEMLCAMQLLITGGDAAGAARLVMQTTNIAAGPTSSFDACDLVDDDRIDNDASKKAFYSVSLKDFFTPWSNVEKTTHAPLNDMTATLIGMVRDGVDFSTALTANIVYTGPSVPDPADFIQSNNHYESLETNGADLSTALIQRMQSSMNMPGENAGVFTTRAAGEAYLSAGTNRRMVDHMMTAFTCYGLLASNQELKDTTRSTDRIRQDVTRSPGGDSSIYLNSCSGCHAGLDPLAGALAYYNWDEANAQVEYTPGNVQPKNLINATTFKAGYITVDDGWVNYWREGQNSLMNWGWDDSSPSVPPTDPTVVPSGNGLVSLGEEILSTQAFAQCQVERAYKHVCLQDPVASQSGAIETLAVDFRTGGYDMKDIFAGVAPLCMGN
jgi:hypothetical protein